MPTPINSVISRLIPAVFNPHVENTPPAASPTERFPDVFVAEAQRTDIPSRSYDRQLGEALARSAEQEAKGRGTVGWCYNAVADAVERQTGRFPMGWSRLPECRPVRSSNQAVQRSASQGSRPASPRCDRCVGQGHEQVRAHLCSPRRRPRSQRSHRAPDAQSLRWSTSQSVHPNPIALVHSSRKLIQ